MERRSLLELCLTAGIAHSITLSIGAAQARVARACVLQLVEYPNAPHTFDNLLA